MPAPPTDSGAPRPKRLLKIPALRANAINPAIMATPATVPIPMPAFAPVDNLPPEEQDVQAALFAELVDMKNDWESTGREDHQAGVL